MLQEAVDSLLDNTRRANAVKANGNRPLKSLSDMLKGKQGRFRQNLLGKRVDYSGRSVIVVGPNLKLHECGLPKGMAAELFKPFIIRKLIERGIVKTVKSAKKIVDKKEPVIWEILENILKGHPILLNRAPTLHRLGIQAFQPKLVEGKAIRLHPLVCTGFNADFDGDQMAVHLPLGNAAILEAQILMLASHNILNPANGAPIAVPSQDMVLGLYYMTKMRRTTKDEIVQGEGLTFYSFEEVEIAYNEGKANLNAVIKVRAMVKKDGVLVNEIIETSVGRVIFNQRVPEEIGYINTLLTKKSLRDIIGDMIKISGVARTAEFLDAIKEIGFYYAFRGGLSFNISDVLVPSTKEELVESARKEVEEITSNYENGFITNNERYNQVIDIWTRINSRVADALLHDIATDNQGFNPIYMMLDSGARGSKEQIRQLGGMRGLMAKPQKKIGGGGIGEIIENPILSNFREGLSILEYFISTHGARKGLADTALKTADAGYLTRRLVDVSQDVIINEQDCGTLRGINVTALKKNDEEVESLYNRILGRVSVYNVKHPKTDEIIAIEGDEITEDIAEAIVAADVDEVEVRSVLTCELKRGVCAKCYGRNLSTSRMVKVGETVGVIAAQSIGEPGTQLTLRTFHVGGTASNVTDENKILAKYDGVLEIEELKTIDTKDKNGNPQVVVIGRSAEMKIIDPKTGVTLATNNIPYGSFLEAKNETKITKGDVICSWDPYNAVIVTESKGTISFENIEEGITFREEVDEQTGFADKVVTDSKDKKKTPIIRVMDSKKNVIKSYNIPVGAHINVADNEKVESGRILVKIPRVSGKTGDITGGLPRITELFEARNPSNPAVVSEIDGIVSFGKIKRGKREIIVESRTGIVKKYAVSLSKHILVQENDFVRAGMQLSDGAITPKNILEIKGPTAVQEYIVNEVQEVYRLQGVKINDKHFEVIVRQMMRKVELIDAGDTKFLEKQAVDKIKFLDENDRIWGMVVVEDAGESEVLKPGQIITARKLRDENSNLKRKDAQLVTARDAVSATSRPLLQGITRSSLQTDSFMSAASFQETTKVLNEAAVRGKVDYLRGLKENVIVGHLIPAGTGMRKYDDMEVLSSVYAESKAEQEEAIAEEVADAETTSE
jgi:DNA-directed RNA polymerase subunit beta'